jgi:hypothetical protein
LAVTLIMREASVESMLLNFEKVPHHPDAGKNAIFPCVVVLHRLASIAAKRDLIAEALQESPKHSPFQLCAKDR